jgi:hypothetical protein
LRLFFRQNAALNGIFTTQQTKGSGVFYLDRDLFRDALAKNSIATPSLAKFSVRTDPAMSDVRTFR